ncbi:hypothetical protein C8A05DRAFT_47901 [Staphylotrichum tortipilum]|uniref:Uncharacterized protein n=1 Tax=Staphylotrichum tortipilum TaxID=2831512 RepID=A0AAN6MB62_9PEZI|nr:hypothetical protein C8A05DRAFT_47901 [Staphylotrichum longicolle]
MRGTIRKQEAQIRQAAGDDNTVRADLESLHGRIKSWAKEHAVDSMSDAINGRSPDEQVALMRFLAQVVRLGPGPENAIEHLVSGPMNKRSPAMCLQGLLAHVVYAEIITRPFFVLDETLSIDHLSCHLNMPTLTTTAQVNESEAHLWRAKTLRLLSAPPPNRQPGEASFMFNNSAKHLFKPTTAAITALHQGATPIPPTAFTELESIIQHAGDLSTRLWSRKTVLRTCGLINLWGERFAARSELMRAHPLHQRFEDEGDTGKCDGWAPGIVTHPAVLGFGSGDGRDYDTPRVWMRAEVWLMEM